MTDFKLVKGEVHVWLEKLDWSREKLGAAYVNLLPVERARVDSYKAERAQTCAIVSAFTLRRVLAGYLNLDPLHIKLSYTAYEKPYLAHDSELTFNVSHSQDYLVLAVALEQEIGVDIEFCQPRSDHLELAQRFFAAEEYQQLLSFDAESRQRAFYRAWVRKEAFVKAVGRGLAFGLSNFAVDLLPGLQNCLLSIQGDTQLAEKWSVRSILNDLVGYEVALAVSGSHLPCAVNRKECRVLPPVSLPIQPPIGLDFS